MGHIAHLKNQFKSTNTFEWSYDYINYKTGQVVLKEKIGKFRECTFAILLLCPNVKRCGLVVLEKDPRMLCAKFGWNWPSGSREENENVKNLRQRRRQRRRRTTDNFDQKSWLLNRLRQQQRRRRRRTNLVQKSSLEPWLRWAKTPN